MPLPPFAATAIGSFPHREVGRPLEALAALSIPAAPQMVNISFWEDMFWSSLAGLPCLIVDPERRQARAKRWNREGELADFYARFLAGERDFLAVAPEASLGLNAFLEKARLDASFGPAALKIQILGPATFGRMVKMEDEKSYLADDPELFEALPLALGGKAAWGAARLRALGRLPVVFLDEPGLTSFGSAFSTLSAEQVVRAMRAAGEVVREGGRVLLGCHVCGNTDWGLLLETGLDIVNFDSFGFFEQFALYAAQIGLFLERGGRIAWGVTPTVDYRRELTAEFLAARLLNGWRELYRKGVDREILARGALIAPACGLGVLSEEDAEAVLALTVATSEILREECGPC